MLPLNCRHTAAGVDQASSSGEFRSPSVWFADQRSGQAKNCHNVDKKWVSNFDMVGHFLSLVAFRFQEARRTSHCGWLRLLQHPAGVYTHCVCEFLFLHSEMDRFASSALVHLQSLMQRQKNCRMPTHQILHSNNYIIQLHAEELISKSCCFFRISFCDETLI